MNPGNDHKWVAEKPGPSTPFMWWTSATGLYTGEHVARTRGRSCVCGQAAMLPPTQLEYHTRHQSPCLSSLLLWQDILHKLRHSKSNKAIRGSFLPSPDVAAVEVVCLTSEGVSDSCGRITAKGPHAMRWFCLTHQSKRSKKTNRNSAREKNAPEKSVIIPEEALDVKTIITSKNKEIKIN